MIQGRKKLISIDGSMTFELASHLKKYEIDWVVSGSALFSSDSFEKTLIEWKKCCPINTKNTVVFHIVSKSKHNGETTALFNQHLNSVINQGNVSFAAIHAPT